MLGTKRIADEAGRGDGTRILVTRYRPRGVRRGEESWAAWDRRVAPSVALLDAFLGKRRAKGRGVERGLDPIPWDEYARRYREEMDAPDAREAIAEMARRSRAGETLTLLCYCEDEAHCHRTLLRDLVLEAGG